MVSELVNSILLLIPVVFPNQGFFLQMEINCHLTGNPTYRTLVLMYRDCLKAQQVKQLYIPEKKLDRLWSSKKTG